MPTLRDARLVDASVQEDATFAEAARALAAAGLPAIAVLGRHRRVLGLFGENDLIAGLVPSYLRELRHTAFAVDDPDALSRRARTVADEPVARHLSRVVTLDIDTSATHAAERFLHEERTAIAVVERDEFVGMLPRSELARLLLEHASVTRP
jgi:CBS-domain-containing membrane protein